MGVILYWISGDDNDLWEKWLLISFTSFPEAHTSENIDGYIKEMLVEYSLDRNLPLITDCAANMLKLKIFHPVLVCFAHRLNTVVSTAFKELTNRNKVINDYYDKFFKLFNM